MKQKIFLIFLLCFLTNCVAAVAGLGSFFAGATIARDKTIKTDSSDNLISTKINIKLFDNSLKAFSNIIEATVDNGIVLLTGVAENESKARLARNLAWSTPGVEDVIDELIIDKISEKGFVDGLNQSFADRMVTSAVYSRIIFASGISTINFHIITVRGTVFVFGTAKSNNELQIIQLLE